MSGLACEILDSEGHCIGSIHGDTEEGLAANLKIGLRVMFGREDMPIGWSVRRVR